jgi:hypothetical protein
LGSECGDKFIDSSVDATQGTQSDEVRVTYEARTIRDEFVGSVLEATINAKAGFPIAVHCRLKCGLGHELLRFLQDWFLGLLFIEAWTGATNRRGPSFGFLFSHGVQLWGRSRMVRNKKPLLSMVVVSRGLLDSGRD